MNPPHLLLRAALPAGVIAVLLGLVIAPADAVQGQAQRWMYLHVPAAWTAYLAFIVVAIASIGYLRARSGRSRRPGVPTRIGARRADVLARAAAEVGVACTALTLLTGSIWGAMTWGTWWTWDARVTTTTLMGLLYVIYLSARALAPHRLLRGVAVLGVVSLAVVPVVHFSVVWWRTLHQPPTILSPSISAPIEPLMLAALSAAVLTFSLFAAWALLRRAAHLGMGAVDDGTQSGAARSLHPAGPPR